MGEAVQQAHELLLETRARWRVPNLLRLERPQVALKAAAEIHATLFPDAILRSLSATYNCIGLVVANRRTWVDPDHLIRILRDDGYRQLAGEAEAEIGDIVVYRDERGEVCHAGIVVSKNFLVAGENRDALRILSQWGADGEYIHDLSRLPALLGVASEFWTDRRNI